MKEKIEHEDIPVGELHGLVNWVVTSVAALSSLGVSARDVHKLALVQETVDEELRRSYYILQSSNPVIWGSLSPALQGLVTEDADKVPVADPEAATGLKLSPVSIGETGIVSGAKRPMFYTDTDFTIDESLVGGIVLVDSATDVTATLSDDLEGIDTFDLRIYQLNAGKAVLGTDTSVTWAITSNAQTAETVALGELMDLAITGSIVQAHCSNVGAGGSQPTYPILGDLPELTDYSISSVNGVYGLVAKIRDTEITRIYSVAELQALNAADAIFGKQVQLGALTYEYVAGPIDETLAAAASGTDMIVYPADDLTGTSAYWRPVDLSTVFAEDFGSLTDYDNSHTAVNKAIAFAGKLGIRDVKLSRKPGAVLVSNNSVTISYSGVEVELGRVVAGPNFQLAISGSSAGVSSALATDTAIGDVAINVNDASGFKEGNLVVMAGTVSHLGDTNERFVSIVTKVDVANNLVYVQHPTTHAFSTVTTAPLNAFKPVVDSKFKNAEIVNIAPNFTTDAQVRIFLSQNSHIENCRSYGLNGFSWGRFAFQIDSCVDCNFVKCAVDTAAQKLNRPELGYPGLYGMGGYIYGSTNSHMVDCKFNKVSRGVNIAASSVQCTAKTCTVTDAGEISYLSNGTGTAYCGFDDSTAIYGGSHVNAHEFTVSAIVDNVDSYTLTVSDGAVVANALNELKLSGSVRYIPVHGTADDAGNIFLEFAQEHLLEVDDVISLKDFRNTAWNQDFTVTGTATNGVFATPVNPWAPTVTTKLFDPGVAAYVTCAAKSIDGTYQINSIVGSDITIDTTGLVLPAIAADPAYLDTVVGFVEKGAQKVAFQAGYNGAGYGDAKVLTRRCIAASFDTLHITADALHNTNPAATRASENTSAQFDVECINCRYPVLAEEASATPGATVRDVDFNLRVIRTYQNPLFLDVYLEGLAIPHDNLRFNITGSRIQTVGIVNVTNLQVKHLSCERYAPWVGVSNALILNLCPGAVVEGFVGVNFRKGFKFTNCPNFVVKNAELFGLSETEVIDDDGGNDGGRFTATVGSLGNTMVIANEATSKIAYNFLDFARPPIQITGNTVLSTLHWNRKLQVTAAATLTVPAGLPNDFATSVMKDTAGTVNFDATAVTAKGALTIQNEFGWAACENLGGDVYAFLGDVG